MALTPEQLSAVIRLQAAADQIQQSARRITDRDHHQLGAIGRQLQTILGQVAEAVRDDQALSAELTALIPTEDEIFWRNVEPQASALMGWLAGVITAETFQIRLEAEARAYAEARVRAERPIGFGAPPA
jgi:hypothetical protein